MSEMTTEQMITAFDSILSERGLDAAASHEGEDWWRFELDGLPIQGGVHTREFRLSVSLCSMSGSVDLDAVYDEIGRRNQALSADGVARFAEEDNYLHVQARAAFRGLTPAHMGKMLDDCVALAKTDGAAALRSTYRAW